MKQKNIEKYIIDYKYLVLIPLALLQNNELVIDKYITETELEKYEELLNEDIQNLSSSIQNDLNRKSKFIIEHRDKLLICQKAECTIYALNETTDAEELLNQIKKELPIEIYETLINEDIISEAFLKNKMIRKKLTLNQ